MATAPALAARATLPGVCGRCQVQHGAGYRPSAGWRCVSVSVSVCVATPRSGGVDIETV